MSRAKLIWRSSGGVLLALLAAGTIAPYASADRFAEPIRLGLGKALGRRVEFGDVRFNLFTGPGFRVHKVVIHEDPAFGLEPFAYVESLEARPRLCKRPAGAAPAVRAADRRQYGFIPADRVPGGATLRICPAEIRKP